MRKVPKIVNICVRKVSNFLLIAAVAACGVAAGEVSLVTEGRPNAVLIVEAESSSSLQAAEALQTYIQKMSGAVLPLVVEGEETGDLPQSRVHVGHTSAAEGQGVPSGFDPSVYDEAFEEEGYVLRTLNDNTLLVAGNNDGPYRGTIFGAYRLLEKLGCRFYFPGDWGEIVPEKTTIIVPELDIESRPDFAVRLIRLSGWVARTREERSIYNEWGAKVGFTPGRLYPVGADGFLALRLVPPDVYFETNPEYFAMGRAGQRHRGRTARHTMLCLSNEEMFEEGVRNLSLAFDGEESPVSVEDHGFGISPPDGSPYCYCDDCKRQSLNFHYPHYGYFEDDRPANSEEYFSFAARLAREFPDKFVSTMAYSLRVFPPQGVNFPPNIAVQVAPITTDVLHAGDTVLWRRSQTMEIIRQYREQTPHVWIYDYNPGLLTGFFVPERDVANMAINAPMYRDIGIKGMNREGRKAFMQTWISYYVTAKLLWDADTDVEALKKEFYTTFFGPDAGPHVQAWWDACERVLGESTMQAHEDWLLSHLYDVEFTGDIRRHVDAALQAQATPEQRERIKAFALIAENLEMYAAMNDAEKRMDYAAAAEAAERMAELKHELNEIYSFFISPCDRERRFFAEGRAAHFHNLAAKTGGADGELVTGLPLEMKFSRDPFNEGVINRWYLPEHDDQEWETRNIYYLLEQHEEPLNERGFHYDGYVWYRTEIDVPEEFDGRDIQLYLGGIINEGWVWVNGEFAGHREEMIWWTRASTEGVSFPVGDLIRPGERNTLAVRVLNHPDEVGGLFRRGFLYVPVE